MTFKIHVVRHERGRHELREGAPPPPPPRPAPVPARIARLVAMAYRIESLVRSGTVGDYADVAAIGGITRARVSQITNLLSLAPDIQERLLFMEKPATGRQTITEQALRAVALEPDWAVQRAMFERLVGHPGGSERSPRT
jgi:hypothetical protein